MRLGSNLRWRRVGAVKVDAGPNLLSAGLTIVVLFDNIIRMTRETRPISWIKAARKNFDVFPEGAKTELARALTIVAEGQYPDIAKPMKGLGSGVFELALAHAGNAYRTVYAVQIGTDIWVLHAFQKKSKSGIKTPKQESDVIKERLKRLKEALK